MLTTASVIARRGILRLVAPAILGLFLMGLLSEHGWQYEWAQGLRTSVQILPLVAPTLGAAAAFDTSRLLSPLLADVGASTKRPLQPLAALILAYTVAGVVAFAVVQLVAAVMLVRSDALGHGDVLLDLEVPLALAAASAFGMAVGCRVGGVVAPLLAGASIYLAIMIGSAYNMLGMFNVAPAVSSILGLDRNPSIAVSAIVLNALIAASSFVIATRSIFARRWLSLVLALSLLATVGAAGWHRQVTRAGGEFVPSSTASTCVATDVPVCGPSDLLPYLADISSSVTQAANQLGQSGLDFPDRYQLWLPGVDPATLPADAVPVMVSPAQFFGDRRAAVAGILASQHICPALINGGPDTTRILDAQARVQDWLSSALRSSSPGRAPDEVVAASRVVAECG